jgi:hypothetical protein
MMARGFDSKSVADQQEERERTQERRDNEKQKPRFSTRRRPLELSRADVLHRLEKAPEQVRKTLQAALDALDADLAKEPEPAE